MLLQLSTLAIRVSAWFRFPRKVSEMVEIGRVGGLEFELWWPMGTDLYKCSSHLISQSRGTVCGVEAGHAS